MSKHVFTIIVAVVIGGSLLAYLFSFQVRSNEVAMVLTFGKPEDVRPEPGWHLRWPWPIQVVRRFDNRLHVHEGRFEETYTRDQYNVITSVCVGWRIDAKSLDQFNKTFGRYEDPMAEGWKELERIIRDRMHDVLGRHDLTELVSVRRDHLNYDEVEREVVENARKDALDTFGINVVLLKIKRLELPQSVTQNVYHRMKTERNREAQSIKSTGKQIAANIKAGAESQKNQILDRAKAEAERIRGEGDAEAARHYKVLKENPELAIYLRKIRALREATKTATTMILDTTTPPFDLLTHGPPEHKGAGAGASAVPEDVTKR